MESTASVQSMTTELKEPKVRGAALLLSLSYFRRNYVHSDKTFVGFFMSSKVLFSICTE